MVFGCQVFGNNYSRDELHVAKNDPGRPSSCRNVETLDIDKLDAAMGLASSPFPIIGGSPLESEQIFRNWIIHQANGVKTPRQRVPIAGSLAFHNLSGIQLENFMGAITLHGWEQEMNEMELDGFAVVWKMTSSSTILPDCRAFHR